MVQSIEIEPSMEQPKLCAVDSKTRKSCKDCRFKKCIAAGMRTNWVTTQKLGKIFLLGANKDQKFIESETKNVSRYLPI
jgi:hypothetical protein